MTVVNEAGSGDPHRAELPPLDSSAAEHEIPLARPVFQFPSEPIVPADPFEIEAPRRSAWWDMVFFIVALAVCRLTAEIVLGAFVAGVRLATPGTATDPDAVHRTVVVPVLFISALATVALTWAILRRRRQPWASVGLTRRGWGVGVVMGLVATGAAYLLIGAALMVMTLINPTVMEQMNRNATNLITALPPMSPLTMAILSVTIGFYEELLFRGFLMTRLRRCVGGWVPAVVLSTALFTFLHASVQLGPALVFISLLSLVLSVVTIWRRSLAPAIVAHSAFDFSQFMLLYFSSGESWQ